MLNSEIKNPFGRVKMWSVYFIANITFMCLTFCFIRIIIYIYNLTGHFSNMGI